ncbi:MAG: Ni/Fe-hydrogenase cytochrome b subunit [Armatimonadetes bacterium]|nr:Ni/Fe-hydrogenase cytochrome b subunit [Armatimonadota bacterium]
MAHVLRIRITFWRVVLVVLILLGLYATAIRFIKGLGAATNLSDTTPWGIWIGFDILCGVALAAGGFTLAAGVYIFRLDRYRPILRATILTAFLGYLMAIVSLLYDIGQPWRIWHPMIMWNEHSPMFEVALCVMLYTTVLALEFSPAVLEWLKLERPLRIIHMLTPPLVIVGVLLSTLHQSTLGTLFVIVPGKIHGLWYSPFLPVLFYMSAIGVGIAMIIFESSMSHRAFGISLHDDILTGLGKAIPVVLGLYLVVRFVTLGAQGSLGLIFEGSPESYLFMLEIGLGFILPIILFSNARIRASSQGRFYSSLIVILGVVLNRLNVSLTGTMRYTNYGYIPSFFEAATTIFVIACGMVAFGLIVKHLPIFPAHEEEEEEAEPHSHGVYAPLQETMPAPLSPARPRMATPTGVAVLAALAALFVAFGYAIRPSVTPKPPAEDELSAAFPAGASRKLDMAEHQVGLKLPHDYAFPKGELSPGKVIFSHDRHVAHGDEACTNCHPKLYPMSSPKDGTAKFHSDERMYGCARCHDGIRAFAVGRECALCHGGDEGKPSLPEDFVIASRSSGVGSVRFSHKNHVLKAFSKCSDCHPRPYEMVAPGTTFGKIDDLSKRMEKGHECAKCHDSRKAFGISADCTKCHARQEKPMLEFTMR